MWFTLSAPFPRGTVHKKEGMKVLWYTCTRILVHVNLTWVRNDLSSGPVFSVIMNPQFLGNQAVATISHTAGKQTHQQDFQNCWFSFWPFQNSVAFFLTCSKTVLLRVQNRLRLEELSNCLIEILFLKWLWHITIHPTFQALLIGCVNYVSRHGQYWHVPLTFTARPFSGFTIHIFVCLALHLSNPTSCLKPA